MARDAQAAVHLAARLEALLLGRRQRRHDLGLLRLARPVHAVEDADHRRVDLAALVGAREERRGGLGERQQQAADFRHGQREQVRRPPFCSAVA